MVGDLTKIGEDQVFQLLWVLDLALLEFRPVWLKHTPCAFTWLEF